MTKRTWLDRGEDGFTLVEILAAIAVLTLLVLLIVQLMAGAAKTVTQHENKMDVDGEMRTIFATMGQDLAHLLKRSDAECIFTKEAGNDYMFFYSETPGYFDNSVPAYARSPLTVVGYRINPNPPNANNGNDATTHYQLERFAKGLSWDDGSGGNMTTGPVFLTYPSPTATDPNPTTPVTGSRMEDKWPTEIPLGATVNYQVIGPQIFRLEFCFLRTDGTLSDQPYLNDPLHANGLQDVSALIVTMALLDEADRKVVSSSSMEKLIGLFVDSTINPATATNQQELPATTWTKALTQPGFAQSAQIPLKSAAQIRIYQHFFYLKNN